MGKENRSFCACERTIKGKAFEICLLPSGRFGKALGASMLIGFAHRDGENCDECAGANRWIFDGVIWVGTQENVFTLKIQWIYIGYKMRIGFSVV